MKTIGILGGMGPMATADFFQKLTARTHARKDEEHLHVLIDSDPHIPSRQKALLGEGISPAPYLNGMARKLEESGAHVIVMPCNTAHAFYTEAAEGLSVPFLHMPRLTVKKLKALGIRKAALLATRQTMDAGVYAFAKDEGIDLILPDEAGREALMHVINNGVKKNNLTIHDGGLMDTIQNLQAAGAEIFVLACSELPLWFAAHDYGVPLLDTSLILAEEAILAAGGTLAE